MHAPLSEGKEVDLEKGLISPSLMKGSNQNSPAEPSQLPSPSSAPALVLSNSGKFFDQAGKRKYVKQVTGQHNGTDLHLAAQMGNLAAVKQILGDIGSQIVGTLSGADFDAEVAEIRTSVVKEENELGETVLFIAADKGHLDVVRELLKYANKETKMKKNRSGYNALHIAASQGHHAIVHVLLENDPKLSRTFGPSNATALILAAARGHKAVVEEFISKDTSLIELTGSNGKNALHFAARQGHVDIVKALLEKDPQLARRTDKKGKTSLHMAVKGVNSEVVKLLLETDAAIVMLPDKIGKTALHIATKKNRAEIVDVLLRLPDTNVNSLIRDHKTALDIAEGLLLSRESAEIIDCLNQNGAVRANELDQSREELQKTVSQIQKEQLEQIKRTNKNFHGIAKDLRKLHREGISKETNSVTVVAVLFATLAFTAIFTVPGGNDNNGTAVVSSSISFKIFFIFNAIALFTSLAVALFTALVKGEAKADRVLVEILHKLMFIASVCTSVAFIASSYIVIGKKHQWAAILVTVIGGLVMAGVLCTLTYCLVKSKRDRSERNKIKRVKSV